MSLSSRQVADEIQLPRLKFYLSWSAGQPLMSHPAYDRFDCIAETGTSHDMYFLPGCRYATYLARHQLLCMYFMQMLQM